MTRIKFNGVGCAQLRKQKKEAAFFKQPLLMY